MPAAIYARYSSENQRPESIEDQVRACRTHAAKTRLVVLEDHVYTDHAKSGANPDRPGLTALREAAQQHSFDVVLVDDLSRLARDNALMLLVLNDLQYAGVRVVSVADNLDTSDDNALLGIQVRGVFNELLLSDLRKKTLRGQLGQKERNFFVGEATFGYCSEAAGTISYDKHGRARPEGPHACRSGGGRGCPADLPRGCGGQTLHAHHEGSERGRSPRPDPFGPWLDRRLRPANSREHEVPRALSLEQAGHLPRSPDRTPPLRPQAGVRVDGH